MLDAHCHLTFLSAEGLGTFSQSVANAGEEHAVSFLSCTVDPGDYLMAQVRLARIPGVYAGCGLHPWWVDEDEGAAMQQAHGVADMVSVVNLVGEIGLDFSPKHVHTQDTQVKALKKIVQACAQAGGKVLSIHCVQASECLLDAFEEAGVLDNNTAILHWFSGSSDHLQRAIQMGCMFSINPHMTETKKGQAYIKAIPLNRMLVETDMPADRMSEDAWADFKVSLTKTVYAIADVRDMPVQDIQDALEENAARILASVQAA